MRDVYHDVLVTQVLNPVVSSSAKTSATVDLKGFGAVNVVFAVGQSGDTLSGGVYWTLKLRHSDDDSSYSDVGAGDVSSGVASMAVNSPSLDEAAYGFGYIGAKRYLQAVATPTGTHTNGTPIGMLALRGKPAYRPVV